MTRAKTSVKSHFDMCLEVLESIMYHAGSWLGSCDTFRPRSLSTFIVWAMVKSWLLLDLASLPKAESRPLEILLLPSALTLLSDIVSVPWDTDMARAGRSAQGQSQNKTKSLCR